MLARGSRTGSGGRVGGRGVGAAIIIIISGIVSRIVWPWRRGGRRHRRVVILIIIRTAVRQTGRCAWSVARRHATSGSTRWERGTRRTGGSSCSGGSGGVAGCSVLASEGEGPLHTPPPITAVLLLLHSPSTPRLREHLRRRAFSRATRTKAELTRGLAGGLCEQPRPSAVDEPAHAFLHHHRCPPPPPGTL